MEILINKLNLHFQQNLPFEDAKEYLNTLQFDWSKHIPRKIINYKRVLVHKNNEFEIFYIFWDKDAFAKIHDHAENGCIMKVLSGQLKENIYTTDTVQYITSSILSKNTVSTINNQTYYHSIKNITDGTAVSLHIYSPPNFRTSYY